MLCEDNTVPYAVDVFPYWFDASAALRAGNVRAGLIGTGVDLPMPMRGPMKREFLPQPGL